MYTNAHSTKRFPTACRFFSQGNCRAGDECLFAHILPIKGSPNNLSHDVLFGDIDQVDAIMERNPTYHHADNETVTPPPPPLSSAQLPSPPGAISVTTEAMAITPASVVQPEQRKSISTSSESHSIHKAIRDLELGQLEKNYKPFFQQPSSSIDVKEAYTVLNLSLPLPEANGDPSELELQLLIPYDYPQTQCTIQIMNADIAAGVKGYIEKSFEKCEWQQQRHLTLLQHLDWLKSNFAVLHSQAITGS